MVFSAERGSISLPTHYLVEVSFEKRVFPIVICPRMSRAGVPTRQHAHTCRKASRHRCVRSIKPGALCGETIQKGSGIELKSFTPGYIGTLLIRHDHDDIRFGNHDLHPIGSAELPGRYRVPVLQARQPLQIPATAQAPDTLPAAKRSGVHGATPQGRHASALARSFAQSACSRRNATHLPQASSAGWARCDGRMALRNACPASSYRWNV